MSLSFGSTGAQVRQLQGSLNLLPSGLPLLKTDGIFGARTNARVREFQGVSSLRVDGIVGDLTLAALELALSLLKKVIPPSSPITVTQKNAAALTAAHTARTPIVLPAVTVSHDSTFRFSEIPASASIHEFLFEIRKAGSVFWMGAAVPEKTTDFTRAQVFFHPTVKQGPDVVAADEDYPEFKGGWSSITRPVGSIQRYVSLEGVQLATAGLRMPMLVPFTTMAALRTPSANMFNDRPVETILAVLEALQAAIVGGSAVKPKLAKLGVASFSSGIHAMKLFLNAMASTGLIKEVIDFDSPVIVGNPHALTPGPAGSISKCFSQEAPFRPVHRYVRVTKAHFSTVSAYGHLPDGPKLDRRLHARIGWMMYHQAMLNSVIR